MPILNLLLGKDHNCTVWLQNYIFSNILILSIKTYRLLVGGLKKSSHESLFGRHEKYIALN